MMKKEDPAEMNKLIKKMKVLYSRIVGLFYIGKYDKALRYIEQEEQLVKHLQGDLPDEFKRHYIWWLTVRAGIYALRGDLARSFKDANDLLVLSQFYDQKRGIIDGLGALGAYYQLSGDLDGALAHLDRAIQLNEENLYDLIDYSKIADDLGDATYISIVKEDIEGAKKYFKRLEEIKELNPKDPFINDAYRLTKAFLLKSSRRLRDRGIAEDLFRELLEEDRSHFIYKLRALIGLCELLLVELKITSDIDLINEIKPLIEKLIGMAQRSSLDYYLVEAYVLHGKLALIMFDIKSSRRFLTQARRMAERFGFIGLADEITSLHRTMMERLDTWKQLEKTNAPLSERIEIARLEDHLQGKFRTRMMKMERITEEELTLYKGSQTCLVCKGSIKGFSIYVCPTCESLYCKECTQAVIDLENQCWSCNSPIDTSKPVKSYNLDLEDIEESKTSRKKY